MIAALMLPGEADLAEALASPTAAALVRDGAGLYCNGRVTILTTHPMDPRRGWIAGGRIVPALIEESPCAA